TGKPPFLGPTPMDTLYLVHTQEPVPPCRIVRDIPPKLEAICLKCLRKDPNHRYPTGDALAEDLRRFAEGQPVQAARPNPIRQGWRSFRQRTGTLLFAVLALVLALVAGGSIATLWMRNQHSDAQVRTTHEESLTAGRELARLRLDRAGMDCQHGAI